MVKKRFYSQFVPKSLRLQNRKQVSIQIASCIKNSVNIDLNSSSALDLACGNGAITFYLASYLKQITGIDEDIFAITNGKKKFYRKNLSLLVSSAYKIPFKNNSLDIVIFRRSYQYIAHLDKLAREIKRVLKPGGICYFEASNAISFVEKDYPSTFYKTIWQLQKTFRMFSIEHITPYILKNPKKYSFTKLYAVSKYLGLIPLILLKILEPFYPSFIWILKKD